MLSFFRKLALPALLAGTFVGSTFASSFDAIYAFGDSLSDAGNVYSQLGIPTAPYSNGRFTNGNVWVQDLSLSLGLGTLTASQLGGTDYAWGSGESGVAPFLTANPATDLTGSVGQIAQFLAGHATADPNALYTIWIGSNDVNDILQNDPSNAAADALLVVKNIDSAISTLASVGAKNFLLLTVPDLGVTPLSASLGIQAAASALSAGLDTTLVGGNSTAQIPSLQQLAASDGLNLYTLDTYALIDSDLANAAMLGFTNTTQSCLTGSVNYVGGTACANPNQYLFWDSEHPTAAADVFTSQAALSLVAPEPASLALLSLGFAGVFAWRRKYRRIRLTA